MKNYKLTCYIIQYLVSICGRTARVTVWLLRILRDPTLICNHTRTKIKKDTIEKWKQKQKDSIKQKVRKLLYFAISFRLTCSTHGLVVIIWFFRFWKRNENIIRLKVEIFLAISYCMIFWLMNYWISWNNQVRQILL